MYSFKIVKFGELFFALLVASISNVLRVLLILRHYFSISPMN